MRSSPLHLVSYSLNIKPYGRFKSKKQPEEEGSTKRQESQQPKETCGVVRAAHCQEKIKVSLPTVGQTEGYSLLLRLVRGIFGLGSFVFQLELPFFFLFAFLF